MKKSVWLALSDETRRRIIKLLRFKELNAGEISSHFDLKKPTISHHLAILKDSGIIDYKKDKNNIIYSLNENVLEEVANAFLLMKKGV